VVYAAGDAAASGGLPLTPVAVYEGEIVASNMLKDNHVKPNYKGVPSVVFTIPPLASVGLQEEVARKLGLHFKTNKSDTTSWYSSRHVGEKYSGFKVMIEEGTDRLLGAHILGSHAEEVINIFAISCGLTLLDLDFLSCLFIRQKNLTNTNCYKNLLTHKLEIVRCSTVLASPLFFLSCNLVVHFRNSFTNIMKPATIEYRFAFINSPSMNVDISDLKIIKCLLSKYRRLGFSPVTAF
jgi:hypothetical protein